MTSTLGTGSITIADLLPRAAGLYGDAVATSYKDGDAWIQHSYRELLDESTRVALGLIALGIEAGDRVAILADTCREWTVADFASTRAGTIVVPIYQTNSPEECEWVLSDSGASAVFCQNADQAAKIEKVRDRLPDLKHVIVLRGEASGDDLTLDALIAAGDPEAEAELQRRTEGVTPEQPYTIIYTSGTTGPPKGCVVSHGNYRAIVDSALEAELMDPDDPTNNVVYLFLPLAHSFARLIQLAALDSGSVIAYFGGDTKQVIAEIQEVKPNLLPSVPRIFEKLYTVAVQMAGEETVEQATQVGLKVEELRAAGQEVPADLQAAYDELDGRLYGLVRGLFGGRLRRAVTGAAPLGVDVIAFFTACGIPLMQGYGMTETATATSCCTPEANRLGSVGRPLPGVEVKLADDGELLVAGPNVFQGYWNNPGATAETLVDGWLHTGDLARIEDGYIFIIGRKKDIIITAGGKNITPANIEAELKLSPLISQAMMHGDRRPYPVALITLDPETAPQWAQEQGIEGDLAAIAAHPKTHAAVQQVLDEANSHYAQVEQIKKFAILPADFTQETGELTPTLKVKRNVVEEMYRSQLDALYVD